MKKLKKEIMAKKSTSIFKIWMLSREYGDLVGVGGVKDVVEQLAKTLAASPGCSVKVVLPLYNSIDPKKLGMKLVEDPLKPGRPLKYEVDMNYATHERRETVRVWTSVWDKVTLLLLESNRFSEKSEPYTYTAADENKDPKKKKGIGHADYFCVNILHQKAALDLMLIINERPEVIHCHDGHTAILPAMVNENPGYRSFFRKNGLLVTIHNGGLGYHQEVADLSFAQAITGLPSHVIAENCLGGAFDPLLVAGSYSVINAVSENYARELQETEEDSRTGWLGHELLKRNVIIEGVTNGIDPKVLSPENAKDLGIAASFNPESDITLKGKRRCKEHLLKQLSRSQKSSAVTQYGSLMVKADQPLFTFIGRLNTQKGIELLVRSLRQMLKEEQNFQIVLLGMGELEEEQSLIELAETKENRKRVCFLQGYSPSLANAIYAAGDFFMIPSEYEPCGLTDFIAQLFGNIPVVHYVGGLVKVLDEKTGLVYQEQTRKALVTVMHKAVSLYNTRPDRIREMQKNGVAEIKQKYTWEKVVFKYIDLYKKAIRMRL